MDKRKLTAAIIKVAVPLIILIVLVFILIKRTSEDEFSLAKYAIVNIEGLDGRASATASMDETGLMNALSGRSDSTDTGRYEQWVSALRVTLDKDSGLKNGDDILVSVSYDEKLARELGIRVDEVSKTVRVTGLEAGTEIDAFSDIKVVTGGISPYVYVNIINESKDEYLSSLQYDVSKTAGLSIGDEITITCRADEKSAAEKGIYFRELTKTYRIEQADRYIRNPGEADKEVIRKLADEDRTVIEEATADKTTHMAYEVTGDKSYLFKDNNEEARDFTVDRCLLAYNNTGTEQKHENGIIIIHRGNIAMPDYSGSEDPYDYLESWFAFVYPDAILDADGNFILATDEPDKRYICGESYEDLMESVGDEIGPYYDYQEINID